MSDYRLGIDIGGTKIEIVALDAEGQVVLRHRVGNPGTYKGLLSDVKKLVDDAHARTNPYATVGVGIPGAVDAHTRLVKNANATWLNGQPFADDLQDVLGFPVRVENDANCFALSEATDGAAAGCHVVFGVILGSGMGGGIIVEGKPLKGLHDIAGEWGHTPLPWVREDEFPMPKCFCGNSGCLERFLCGPALAESWKGPGNRSVQGIEDAAASGDAAAQRALDLYVDRLGRACALIVNILDPDAIVLGGGVSNLNCLYERVPDVMKRYVITPECNTKLLKNKHGDSSGVRGAAWLWG
ncbi:fructokinase [Acetobacter pasteurianus]|uniref:Fructokinase n=4 Tax=Acetobacter pasteurianus TaxID=438 RepID=A0A401WTL6_ACEPA|nr:ROK family protein [Acetobacter pasteurianus]BAU38576.1 fructokinase [Acetobacter pasteurianus NBRC 101655]ASC06779.1 Fructokinase [Acetobacter pasteurianus subsp. pasteurianus]OAZ67788.1 Fructokinase [Acetobacter pasteurianus]BAH99629.1 fructokinase [Acetobacter pasteurianus IFO 3283-01]BAI02682.1 fructokinase [Acetobacter pasteurianus IFO 3283-03]